MSFIDIGEKIRQYRPKINKDDNDDDKMSFTDNGENIRQTRPKIIDDIINSGFKKVIIEEKEKNFGKFMKK